MFSTPCRLSAASLHPRSHRAGFALVLTLIILSLLVVVVVSYLTSMTNEHMTANAYTSKARAEQAAQAGVEAAQAMLAQAFRDFPDSATVWDTQQSANYKNGGTGATSYNEGTTLYLRAMPKSNSSPLVADPRPAPSDTNFPNDAHDPKGNNPNNPDCKEFVLPLVSGVPGGLARLAADKAGVLPNITLDDKIPAAQQAYVDLNTRRYKGDIQGVIGSPPDWTGTNPESNSLIPKPARAFWINLTDSTGKLTGRYAFWVEDESFRANLNYAGIPAVDNPLLTRRDNLQNYALKASDVNLTSLLTSVGLNDPGAIGQGLLTTRQVYPGQFFPEPKAFAHNLETMPSASIDKLRYITTTQSAGLNLSRHGTQRVSLNSVIHQTAKPDPSIIQNEFDKIVDTIKFHAPQFGQRYYRYTAAVTPDELNKTYVSSDSTTNHTKIYLAKTAANIRDYIDNDSFPTVILPPDTTEQNYPNGKVRGINPPPVHIRDFGTDLWAVGKDAMPFMQECGARYRCNFTTVGTSRNFEFKTDYYVEVWNMSDRDIKFSDLGDHPYLRVSSPAIFVGGLRSNLKGSVALLPPTKGVSPSDPRPVLTSPLTPTPRDCVLDLSHDVRDPNHPGVAFPAGVCTVITSDPDFTEVITDLEARKHVLRCDYMPDRVRVYTGVMPNAPGTNTQCDVIRLFYDATPDNVSGNDYFQQIVLASDSGYIDGLGAAPPLSGSIVVPYAASGTQPIKIYGGYFRGNWTNTSKAISEGMQTSNVGDPRTINEQFFYNATAQNQDTSEKTRFNNYDSNVGPTFGLPNYNSVRPNRVANPWPDAPPMFANPEGPPNPQELVMDASKASAVIANAPLTSIGQLGDVFDSARTTYKNDMTTAHGGGRTYKIGQHDDRWDGDESSASRGWTSWRLTDFFCVAGVDNRPGLTGIYGMVQPGLINLNGLRRDKGAALRAALNGFRFQPALTSGLVSQTPDVVTTSESTPAAGDPALIDQSNQSLQPKVDALINQIAARLNASSLNADGTINYGISQTGTGPLLERGEISELPLFGRTNTSSGMPYSTTDLTGVDLSSKAMDRGREELVRRLIEMTTTRGDVFTVYAVGQALTQSNPKDVKTIRVLGTQRLKVTFRLVPKAVPVSGTAALFHPGVDETTAKWTDGDTTRDWNIAAQITNRFAKPDHYDIETVFSTTSD